MFRPPASKRGSSLGRFSLVINFFQWQWSGLLIPLFIGLGAAALSKGASLSSPETWLFVSAFVFFGLAAFWALGFWLTSNTLRERNPYPWSRNIGARIAYYAWACTWACIGSAACIAIFALGIMLTNFVWERKALSEMDGLLVPANDPDPPSHCSSIPDDATRLYLGNSVAWSSQDTLVLIGFFGNDIIWAERQKDGSMVLNADLVGDDGKSITSISRNHFVVNENHVIESLVHRPDRSTIVLSDQYGNALRIRYINKHAMQVFGKIVLSKANAPDVLGVSSRTIEIKDSGVIVINPGNNTTSGECFRNTNIGFDFR